MRTIGTALVVLAAAAVFAASPPLSPYEPVCVQRSDWSGAEPVGIRIVIEARSGKDGAAPVEIDGLLANRGVGGGTAPVAVAAVGARQTGDKDSPGPVALNGPPHVAAKPGAAQPVAVAAPAVGIPIIPGALAVETLSSTGVAAVPSVTLTDDLARCRAGLWNRELRESLTARGVDGLLEILAGLDWRSASDAPLEDRLCEVLVRHLGVLDDGRSLSPVQSIQFARYLNRAADPRAEALLAHWVEDPAASPTDRLRAAGVLGRWMAKRGDRAQAIAMYEALLAGAESPLMVGEASLELAVLRATAQMPDWPAAAELAETAYASALKANNGWLAAVALVEGANYRRQMKVPAVDILRHLERPTEGRLADAGRALLLSRQAMQCWAMLDDDGAEQRARGALAALATAGHELDNEGLQTERAACSDILAQLDSFRDQPIRCANPVIRLRQGTDPNVLVGEFRLSLRAADELSIATSIPDIAVRIESPAMLPSRVERRGTVRIAARCIGQRELTIALRHPSRSARPLVLRLEPPSRTRTD